MVLSGSVASYYYRGTLTTQGYNIFADLFTLWQVHETAGNRLMEELAGTCMYVYVYVLRTMHWNLDP